MNRIFQNPALTTLLLVTMVVAAAACHSRPGGKPALPANAPAKPHMWDTMYITQGEERQFLSYSAVLTGQVGQPVADSVFYSAAEFNQMVNYFADTLPKVEYIYLHLAVVDPKDSIGISNTALANKMIYIFETIDSTNNVKHEFIVPNDASFGSNCEIGATHASACEAYYSATVVKQFLYLLDPADSNNYPDRDKRQKLSNTMFIKYFLSEFQELVGEIDYQAKYDQDTISGFLHFFAAMPDTAAKGTQGAYSNRILSQLEFTQDQGGIHRPFYLDTTPNFWSRLSQTPLFDLPGHVAPYVHPMLDNGPLCPPTCN